MRFTVIRLFILCVTLGWAKAGAANPSCKTEQRAKLVSLQGTVFFDADSKGEWRQAQLDEAICQHGRVRVEPYSRASLSLPNGVVLRLDEGTILSLHDITRDEPTALDLLKGFIHFISRTPKHLEITSPIANAGPEGTEFAMKVDETKASLWVYEGAVRFFNHQGSIRLTPGQGAEALDGQAPRSQIEIKPQDAVNWALYYPPILHYPKPSASLGASLRTAIEDFRRGQVDQALMRLDALAPEQRTPYFFKVRGAVRLTAGRVALAREDIRSIFATNPNDAEALALLSILALTQNRKEEALQLANKAVASDPASPTAYSALSYAEQSRFELDKALAAAGQATQYAPHDAMVWARKAELQLAQGATTDSEQAARRALELDSGLERTQTVTGFSYLLRMETAAAKQAFEQAVKLDSTSPLARLGLGLAKIRGGDLEEGRHDLEIAAILDPNNSLIRSYLGKAYYEEKRSALAEDQFRLAKERDPKDPTPYFYDSLKKQTENRPIEALQDLQKAIALNDNRAVYRSKQLLDADRAARGATLARIYADLGFEQRGVVEAISSLQIDPTNFSAHRFLSDTYINQSGRETAQLSELLQAKMLQPININPVQPHLSVAQRGLHTSSSVANASFQDFTRVFERNRPQLLASGLAGDQNTFGDEATISGIYDKLSYSFGQYHFGSDRAFTKPEINPEKFNISKEYDDIYDAFLQAAINDRLDLKLEYIYRHSNLEKSRTNQPASLKENNFRLGGHWKPTISQQLLALYSQSHALESIFHPDNPDVEDDFPFDESRNFKTTLWDAQHFFITDRIKLTTGFNHFNIVRTDVDKFKNNTETDYKPYVERGFSFYEYAHLQLLKKIELTLGFSHDEHKGDETQKYSGWNPKLGLQWDFLNHVKLRLAYMSGFKKLLYASQTLEPTQVSGFNQIFDFYDNRTYKFIGSAVDFSWPGFFSGFEFNNRETSIINSNRDYDNLSNKFKTYFNITISDNFSLFSTYEYEKNSFYTNNLILKTHKIPLQLRYFNPNGWFLNLGATWVLQDKFNFEYRKNNSTSPTKSKFMTLDTVIGYRLPKRLGTFSLEIKNILDTNFEYNDLSTFNQSNIFNTSQEFFPRRTILGRITFSF